MIFLILEPTNTKIASGSAEPIPYPIIPTIPANVPVSAGPNRIQAPNADATSVAIVKVLLDEFLETM
mgnify:FL=1